MCRIETGCRDFASRSGVSAGVLRHRLKRLDRLLQGAEAQQAFTRGQHGAEAGVLKHDRPTAGEIIGAALAEPATVRNDVPVLGDAELATRSLDVLLVLPGIARHFQRGAQMPARFVQPPPRRSARPPIANSTFASMRRGKDMKGSNDADFMP